VVGGGAVGVWHALTNGKGVVDRSPATPFAKSLRACHTHHYRKWNVHHKDKKKDRSHGLTPMKHG
jgi:hypothetical protein